MVAGPPLLSHLLMGYGSGAQGPTAPPLPPMGMGADAPPSLWVWVWVWVPPLEK